MSKSMPSKESLLFYVGIFISAFIGYFLFNTLQQSRQYDYEQLQMCYEAAGCSLTYREYLDLREYLEEQGRDGELQF